MTNDEEDFNVGALPEPIPFQVGLQVSRGVLSAQSDTVLFAQSRNVLLTASRLEGWKQDNY